MKYLAIILTLFSLQAYAFDGLVTGVHDGDSLAVAGQPKKIRVRYMDAPEIKAFKWQTQPYAFEARDSLAALCLGKTATLTNMIKDKYNRTAANVSCDGVDVAKYQINNGSAWNYKYAPKRYRLLANDAKDKKLGLWAQVNPINPIYWRKGVTQ